MSSCVNSFTTYSLRAEIAGNGVVAAFPTMSRQATFSFTKYNLAIIGIALSTTMIANANSIATLAVALAMNQGGTTLTFTQDMGCLAHHVAIRNSTSGSSYYQPANQVTHYMCPPGYGFFLPVGSPVSLYFSTDGDAGSYISAVATLFTVLAK